MNDLGCKEPECERPLHNKARQLCNAHYLKWYRATPKEARAAVPMGPTPTSWRSRVWKYVDKSGDCWEWIGGLDGKGYGVISRSRLEDSGEGTRKMQAHRAVYEEVVGPIPDGLDLDHLCRNRSCVNPSHLEPVTRRVNLLRGVGHSAANAQKTHCKRGHEFTPANTYIRTNRASGFPNRECRRCIANASAEYKRKKKREGRTS